MSTLESTKHNNRHDTTSSNSYQIKQAMDKAKEYERRMISRVQYLVQEERKVLKKIDSTKQLAEKTSKLKEQKIQDLRYKLEHERRE